MDYKTKIKHAETVAEKLQEKESLETIESYLKEFDLYDRDISEVIISAKKILGEKYQSKIRENLLGDKEIHGAKEFSALDGEILDSLIKKEVQNLALLEKKNITKLVKEGLSEEEILDQADTRFLSEDRTHEHLTNLLEIKKENSGSSRTLNILGGIGVLIITGVVFMISGRLFYILPVIGVVMIIKGLMPKKIEYNT